jgi:hypothetical protein
LGTRSAASPCCGSERGLPGPSRLGRLLTSIILLIGALSAQLNTGILEGTVHTSDGRPMAGESIVLAGDTGFRIVVRTDSTGRFSLVLPYGRYRMAGAEVAVTALATLRVELVRDLSGAIHVVEPGAPGPGIWTDHTRGRLYPEAFSFEGLLLGREPAMVTEPLDFTGLADGRLGVVSERGFSWTDTQYRLHGLDATDSYQPGLAAIFPDVQAIDAVVVRSAFAQSTSSSYGTEAGLYLSQPRASWHGALSTADTGSVLASDNLPPVASRGLVEQAEQFQWFTRDQAEIGGALGKRIDLYASGSGQWASQSEPLAPAGSDQRSRLLFGNARGRISASSRDRFDALYSGSRVDLSDGGLPASLEALTGNRMAPSFVLPGGFSGDPEVDHLDFVQVGWTHLLPAASGEGAIEVRYGYSIAHLDTRTTPSGQSRVELLGGTVTGVPPLANLAVRPRHEMAASWQPAVLRSQGVRHQIAAGGSWKTSEPRNRFTAPSDTNLITENGAPAFVMELNTPLDSRARLQSLSGYLMDHITLQSSLSVDLAGVADFSRGSLPAQSSPGGLFTPARSFGAAGDLIVWNSVSPRAGFAWQVPHAHGLVLRGAYARLDAPLAGRYLDFGNPNSLGGSLYQWNAANRGTTFQPVQQGSLVLRFGGPYSSISPALGRPYADEFNVGAEVRIAPRSTASIHLFRRDEKNRIAAVDTGIPAQAFTPVSILDPGPDGIPGTFDDQKLTVYAQDPATFGQDHYLLTNPPGLRETNAGVATEMGTEWRGIVLHASLVAEKSYGPTNPGDAFYENDPGVIGALFLDPNTGIHATGRIFMDRAYVGKLQAVYRLPAAWGGIEVASLADYTDGLVFARQLLVTGLPQGPMVVATTVRGSPEGGNRAQYALNWNLRIGREFALAPGRLAVSADILNVTNAGQSLQENDLSGASFNLRLPVAIEPPRFVRLGIRYEF